MSLTGSMMVAGGLAGTVFPGTGFAIINESYSQMRVSPDTSDPHFTVVSGGIEGCSLGR